MITDNLKKQRHPIVDFWVNHSCWADSEEDTPEEALCEGRLCIKSWNAALKAVGLPSDHELYYLEGRDYK